jgi:hypothetical protein
MEFNSLARSQAELVAERTQEKPPVVTESLELPGLPMILGMTETDLRTFLLSALKSRRNLSEFDLSLGSYDIKEISVQGRFPKASQMHNISLEETASILCSAMGSDPKVVGVRVKICEKADRAVSELYLKVAAAKPTAEDEQFKPTLSVTYLTT